MAAPRVIVVGAGPAGVRAAERLVAAGLRPTVVDEGLRAGGQIYRQQPPGFTREPEELYGTEAGRAVAVHGAFAALAGRIDHLPETLAWNIEPGALHVARDGVARKLPFDAVILATGATDRLLPVPGWTRPGVYSLGGAQVSLKAQACTIGARVAFLGTGPLLYLVAAQYRKAGAEVAAVLDTSPASARFRALPLMASRPALLVKGAALMWTLRGVPILRGVTPLAIDGDDSGVTGLRVKDAKGREHQFAADAVAMGWHLRPETQLADLAGVPFEHDALSGLWMARMEPDGRTAVPGVYLAGDGARILGADGAEIAGRLAATSVLADHGIEVPVAEMIDLIGKHAVMDRFRRGLLRAFPWPGHLAAGVPDDTLLCRCEAITAGELRRSASDLGAPEVNRAKALTRVGMGRCQGRYCGPAGQEVLAAARGVTLADVGRLRGQAPVKPLSISTVVEDA
jgi:NADPH-dependent 2,4-dienoyl-CoA reductase/sulfur reductase-like enzyme